MRSPITRHCQRQEVIAWLLVSGGLAPEAAASLMPRPQLEPRSTRDGSSTDPRFVNVIAGREDGIPRHLWEGGPLAMERLRRQDLWQWKALRIKWGTGLVQTDKAVGMACGRGVHWARHTLARGLDALVDWLWLEDGTARWPTADRDEGSA